MASIDTRTVPEIVPARRRFLQGAGKASLSATAVALLIGCETMASSASRQGASDPKKDVSILNVALGLEHEAINAYQLGAESGLLSQEVLPVAVAPVRTKNSGAAKAAVQLRHGQAHRGRAAVYVVVREVGGEEAVDQLLHLPL